MMNAAEGNWFAPAPTIKALALTFVLALGLVVNSAGLARAHFLLNINVRVIHVEHLDDGLRVYLRLPMPYLVADRLGPVGPDGLPEPAPYTTNRIEHDRLVHYLDAAALAADPLGLGRLVADGHQVSVGGSLLTPEVEQLRAYPGAEQPSFASIEDAKRSFEGPYNPERFPITYVGDAVVDTVLRYRSGGPVYDYAVSSNLDPGLEGQEETANLLLDHFPGETEVFRARGLLDQPIEVSRSALAAVTTFVTEGVRHILDGWDHVLFVLCLALGAIRFSSLLWRATGFTIGHSVTLAAGFFGFVPSGNWFVPAVEMGIALSIIYAAVFAVSQRGRDSRSETTMFLITTTIGLLHGLGFSFVLHEILQVDSPNIWQSLLAFNLGVEIGQVLIILAAWPLFRLVARWNDRAWAIGRWGVAVPCVAVAAVWTAQRALMVIRAL
jgi:hypothetical protein